MSENICALCKQEIEGLWYEDKGGRIWHVHCLSNSREALLEIVKIFKTDWLARHNNRFSKEEHDFITQVDKVIADAEARP